MRTRQILHEYICVRAVIWQERVCVLSLKSESACEGVHLYNCSLTNRDVSREVRQLREMAQVPNEQLSEVQGRATIAYQIPCCDDGRCAAKRRVYFAPGDEKIEINVHVARFSLTLLAPG